MIQKPALQIAIVFLLLLTFIKLNAQRELNTRQLNNPPIIDGIFEPEIWFSSDSSSGFIQLEPSKGTEATEKTIVFTGYDKNNFYVLIKCYQNTVIIAKIQDRDNLTKNDDAVSIFIDTYKDNRSGYGFYVNPLGTQVDFIINDDGKSIDTNWDTEWTSAVKTFDWGWLVEIAIPFTSIKYNKNITSWGINFGRVIRSNSETSYWSGKTSEDFRMSQNGILTGIQTPQKEMQVTLFPYITGKFENNEFDNIYNKTDADFGGDLKWQISPNLSLNGTYRPDFATVEADRAQINLTRYELSYPEKRLFFQEGNEMFGTRIETFYSRRIQDIAYGEKLSGKIGKYQMNVFNTHSLAIADENEPAAFFTAARVKRDFLKSSTLGATFVDKTSDTSFTRSFSTDYVLNLNETWKFTGQFVGSFPGDFKTHSAWFVRFARENNIYHYHIRYSDIGENFQDNVNQTGFITDDDRREIDSDITYKWWIKTKYIKYMRFLTKNNVFWSHTGTLRSYNFTNMVDIYLQNRFSFIYSYNIEYKLYEKEYYNHRHWYTLGYNTDEWSSVNIDFQHGKNFDRDFYLVEGNANAKLLKKLALEYSASYIHFTPDTLNNSTFINILTINYNFSKDLWIKLFVQNSTASDNVYVYGLFGWRFKPPFGALYLIYSHDEMFVLDYNVNKQADVLFLKLTYPIGVIK